jgi:hypothetical protein
MPAQNASTDGTAKYVLNSVVNVTQVSPVTRAHVAFNYSKAVIATSQIRTLCSSRLTSWQPDSLAELQAKFQHRSKSAHR